MYRFIQRAALWLALFATVLPTVAPAQNVNTSRQVALQGRRVLAPLIGCYRDDFTTTSGTLNGRTIAGLASYTTVLESTPGGSTVNALQVTTTGKGTLAGTSANTKAHGYRNPATNYDYASVKLGAATTNALEAHIAASGTTLTAVTIKPDATVPNVSVRPVIAGVNGTSVSLAYDTPQIGDVIEHRTVNISGTDYLEIYFNGDMIGSPTTGNWVSGRFSLTAAGVALNGKHGFVGNLATAGVDSLEGCDMTVVSRILLMQRGRVAQINNDGTVTQRVKFAYTGRAPTAIKYRVHASSDNSTFASGTAASLTTDDSAKVGYATLTFTPASSTTGYWTEIYREDAVNLSSVAATITGVGPSVLWGNIIASDGQSLNTQADIVSATTAATWAAPANSWKLVAASGTPSYQRANNIVAANTPVAALLDTVLPALGNKPINYIAGGVGGTSISVRALGSANDQALIDAVDASGGGVRFMKHIDGQSDVGGLATYQTIVPALYNARFARWPTMVAVEMYPLAGMYGVYSDVQTEAMRRYQAFELPNADARFVAGPFTMDQQHDFTGSAVDPLHLKDYGEQERRAGLILAHYIDSTTYPCDWRGPTIASAHKVNDHTIEVTFNLNCFTGMSMLNTSYTTGKTDPYDGGLRFGTAVGTPSGATSNTVTTVVHANSAPTWGSPSGGQIVGTFNFAAASFPGTAYVGGPYGKNPFNLSDNNTVNLDYANKASMVVGTFSTDPAVAVQPYWNASGNDYIIVSALSLRDIPRVPANDNVGFAMAA